MIERTKHDFRILRRIEGLALGVGATLLYSKLGASWWIFAALFLVPDVAMLGYLGGARLGARLYNVAHTYVSALSLAGIGLAVGSDAVIAAAVIWAAHIGFDRALGYGLKYETGFNHTHLSITLD